jgi:hypothetical protein
MAGIVARNFAALLARARAEERAKTAQEKVADAVTAFTGSMPFVYLHLLLFGGWIVINLGWTPLPRFDRSGPRQDRRDRAGVPERGVRRSFRSDGECGRALPRLAAGNPEAGSGQMNGGASDAEHDLASDVTSLAHLMGLARVG